MDEIEIKMSENNEECASDCNINTKEEVSNEGAVPSDTQSEKQAPLAAMWEDSPVGRKYKMTTAQIKFVDNYLANGGNATAAYRVAYGEGKAQERSAACMLRANHKVLRYIEDLAANCAQIQYEEIIQNKKAPFAVRNDAIKSFLDRAGVKQEESDGGGQNVFLGDVKITIDK